MCGWLVGWLVVVEQKKTCYLSYINNYLLKNKTLHKKGALKKIFLQKKTILPFAKNWQKANKPPSSKIFTRVKNHF
jgi:hypothetical protein